MAEREFVESARPGELYSAHIHSVGCADLEKEKRKGFEQHPAPSSLLEWAHENFDDIASDVLSTSDPQAAWDKEVLFEAAGVSVMPCAIAAGFAVPEGWKGK